MLNSLTRHFNETVFRGPVDEGGGGAGGDIENDLGTGGGDGGGSDPDGGGSLDGETSAPEKLSVREEIKKSWREASAEPPQPAPKDKKTGRFRAQQQPGETEPAPAPAAAQVAAPPASLPKELAAEWSKTSPAIQAAFVKREQDMAKGVDELKQKYTLIDQAIAPHTDALRQMNATPGEAVNRMFLWFKALAGKPAEAFPALAQSMGIDWKKLSSPVTGPAPAAQQQEQAPAATEIPEPVRQYVGSLEGQVKQLGQIVQQMYGQFGGIQENINTQNMARTTENLNLWSKDKPHFADVRQDMAKLIETGIVPLRDGQVDLDTAYERAIYFNPEVRAKVLAEQQQANQQVQQTAAAATTAATQNQVNRARKASVSLPASTTPSGPVVTAKKKSGQRLSVRESLMAAISDARDQ